MATYAKSIIRSTTVNNDLMAAIGVALGHDGPYQESQPSGSGHQPGTRVRVLAGVVDGERVAWVEYRAGRPDSDGHLPVDLLLHVKGEDGELVTVDVPTYNPYFECDVHLMRFHGDALLVIYTEKHDTIALRLTGDRMELREIDDDLLVHGDVVAYRPYKANVGVLDLAGFQASVPLPVVTEDFTLTDAHRALLPGPEQYGFPARAAVWARLRELLTVTGPVPQYGVDVLIGALAQPYWFAPPTEYHYDALSHWSRTSDGPWWLPAAWYLHLASRPHTMSAAHAWLAWLDRLAVDAAPTPACGLHGWQPGWTVTEGAAQLAMHLIRYRAGLLAGMCRAGALPDGWWGWEGKRWAHSLPVREFPPGFVTVWNQLPKRCAPRRDW